MNVRFDNKTALVTGAGRGIGKAVAKKLHSLGAKVIAVSKTKSNLDSLEKQCPGIITVEVDLGNWDETKAKLEEYASKVDLLVNNAAASTSEKIGEITEESIDTLIGINFKGCINLIQMVAAGMKERKYGSIVNVSSISSMAAFERHCVYGSTKSALDMVTKIAAKELGPFNIRVNSINPTVVWTDMGQLFWSEETLKKEMTAKIPMGRFVEVEEVVDPILFLLSDQAAMISGALLPVDGGCTACR